MADSTKLFIKHQSPTGSKSTAGIEYSIVRYGVKSDVQDYIDATPPHSTDIMPGYILQTQTISDMPGGQLAEVTEKLLQPYNFSGFPEVACGPNQHTLTTRMINIPLDNLRASYWVSEGFQYATYWNHSLARLGTAPLPDWATTATTTASKAR